jgi:hypothetical protein
MIIIKGEAGSTMARILVVEAGVDRIGLIITTAIRINIQHLTHIPYHRQDGFHRRRASQDLVQVCRLRLLCIMAADTQVTREETTGEIKEGTTEETREEITEETRHTILRRLRPGITGIVVTKTKVLLGEVIMGRIDDHMTVAEAATAEVGIIDNLRSTTRTAHAIGSEKKHSGHCVYQGQSSSRVASNTFYNE